LKTKLFSNIGYLALAQIGTYLLPLITIPYISRTVGVSNYGLIEYATVAMLYFISIVEFSFNTTSTRKIAANRNNFKKISLIYSSALFARLFFLLISTIIFAACLFLIPEFKSQYKLMILAYPVVLGWAVYPLFLFQGLQELKVIAFGNLSLKVLATILIFIVINDEADFIYVAAINGGAQLLISLGILIYVPYKFKEVKLFWPSWRPIKASIYEGRFIFTSDFFNKVYAMGSVFIAGFYVSPASLGLYAAGMKLIIVGKSFIFQPLLGALFPHLNEKFKESKEGFLKQLRKTLLILLAVTGTASTTLMLFSEFFINLIFGNEYSGAAHLLFIMAPILTLSSFVHIYLYQGVLTYKKDKIYLGIIVLGGLVTLLLNVLFIPKYGVTGAAYIRLIGEAFLAIVSFIAFQRIKQKEMLKP
jgi:PST family polysaccharide transporter